MAGMFRRFIDRLHLGTSLYEIGASISGLWPVAVSAVIALGTGWWAWATQWGYLPVFLSAFGIFTASIWLLNGIIWLRRQNRPSKERISFDYSYGLALEDLLITHDDGNNDNYIEFRLAIRNVTNGPVRFNIEKLSFYLEDRFVDAKSFSSIIPRGTRTTLIPASGFRREAAMNLSDRPKGRIEYSIKYGHPDFAYSWVSEKSLELLMKKFIDDGKVRVRDLTWVIRSENDYPIP